MYYMSSLVEKATGGSDASTKVDQENYDKAQERDFLRYIRDGSRSSSHRGIVSAPALHKVANSLDLANVAVRAGGPMSATVSPALPS